MAGWIPYNSHMTRKKRIERVINSILRLLTVMTIGIIGVAVVAVIFEDDVVKLSNKLFKIPNSTSQINAQSYQGDIEWAILRGQDRQDIRFKFIDDTDEELSVYSVKT